MNYVTKRDDWTKEARKIMGRDNVNIYWNREYKYVSVIENGDEKYSIERWNEFGKNKLRHYAFLVRNGLHKIGLQQYKKILEKQEYEKQYQLDDFERDTTNDAMDYGYRSKVHFPQS